MRLAFAPMALFAISIAHGATPIDGWYTSAFGGYTYLPNNINLPYNGLSFSSATYDESYDAGGNVGYKSTPMRYEGEITYLNANLNSFKINNVAQTNVSGRSNALFAMANVYYDFPNLQNLLQPFVGGGIGYGWLNAKLNSDDPSPLGATAFSGSDTKFAYQATAGLTYNFSENYALNIGYRYLASVHTDELGKSFQANLANIGATYRFNEGHYK